VAAVAWAGLAHAEVLQDETTRIEHHVGKFEAVMVSLGFGSLAGFGLPVVLLTGYGCDKVEACKEVAGSLLHATIFQSHAIALVALFALVVSLLAGNEKISQTLKLPVQLVTMPANALFALLLPLAVTYGPTEPLRTAEVTVAVAGVGQVSWALFLGLVAFSAAVLVLTARLMTSLLVWISPFPLVDALFNVAFHIYAGTAVVLMVFFPKVALVFLIAQYIALILLLRTLPRMTNKVFDALKRLWAKYSVVRVAG
jgi:hypothetical protein